MRTRLFPFNLNPPRLSFPLPMAKVALTGIPAGNAKKKRRSLLPFLLPAAGIGADYLFNQGKVSKGLWGALNSLFASSVTPIPLSRTNTATANTRLPAPVTAAPTVVKPANPPAAPLPPNPSLPSSDELVNRWKAVSDHVYAPPDTGDEWHEYLNRQDRYQAQQSIIAGKNELAGPPSKHPYGEAALNFAQQAGGMGALASLGPGRVLGALGKVVRPVNFVAGTIGTYNDPINREVGKGYAAAQALQEGLWLSPTTAPAMMAYNIIKPDLQNNLNKSQLTLHANAAIADIISEQYRTARDEVAKGLKPIEHLYEVGKDMVDLLGSYNPNVAKQEWRSKIWEPIAGEGSTGAVNLGRPALERAAKKLMDAPQYVPRPLDLRRAYDPDLAKKLWQARSPNASLNF